MSVKVDDIKATAVEYNRVFFWPNNSKICAELMEAMNDYCNQYKELRVNWDKICDKMIIDSVEFKDKVIYSFDSYCGVVFINDGHETVKLALFRVADTILETTINNFEFAFYVDEATIKYYGKHARYNFEIIKQGKKIYSVSESAEDVWESIKEYGLI